MTTTTNTDEILPLLDGDPWDLVADSTDVPRCVSCPEPAALLVRTRIWGPGRTVERVEDMCLGCTNDAVTMALHSGPQSHTRPVTVRVMCVLGSGDDGVTR